MKFKFIRIILLIVLILVTSLVTYGCHVNNQTATTYKYKEIQNNEQQKSTNTVEAASNKEVFTVRRVEMETTDESKADIYRQKIYIMTDETTGVEYIIVYRKNGSGNEYGLTMSPRIGTKP